MTIIVGNPSIRIGTATVVTIVSSGGILIIKG